MKQGGTGTSMTIEYRPGIEQRRAKRRRREEARWAARSGPVRVKRADSASLSATKSLPNGG